MSTTSDYDVVDIGLLGARWLLLELVVCSCTSSLECSLFIFTTCGYCVADVSHVAMFSNFDGNYISDNLRLGSNSHDDVDRNGGPDIEHLVKLNMEARLAGRRR